jgi:hypothetical protein
MPYKPGYYETRKERYKEYRNKWNEKNPAYIMYHNAKRRSKEFGLPFDLDWKAIEIPDVCPVLGIPMFKGAAGGCENSPSLDRIHPEKGYVNGNVTVISAKANRLKNDGTLEDFQAIVRYLLEHQQVKLP